MTAYQSNTGISDQFAGTALLAICPDYNVLQTNYDPLGRIVSIFNLTEI